MASVYKRNDTYYIKFYENGKRVRRSLGTSSRNKALKLKEQIERELAAGKFRTEAIDMDVAIFWQKYIEWARLHKQPKTVRLDSMFWRQLIAFCHPKKLGDVTSRDIERFKARRVRDGLKPRSINGALRHLQAIYNHAAKLGYYNGPNPVRGVSKFKVEKNPPKYLEKDEIDRLLEAAATHGRDIHAVFALGTYAGMRKNEIVNTRWEWFDFDRKLITLASHDGFHIKNSESRTIPLHDRLASILEPYRANEGFIFMPEKEKPGKHEYRYEFKRAFHSVAKEAGLEWVTPHVLRHTFASQLAIAGVSLYKISKWLGHSDVKTTQIYAHLQTHDEDINRF